MTDIQPKDPSPRRRFAHNSISEELVDLIRERVNSGHLKPGERIFEASLAAELGVSRSPLREALVKLSFEGLVRTELHRGTYVMSIDATRLQQLLEFRLVLEDFAVRRIVENNAPEDITRLREALDVVDTATHSSGVNATIEADLKFHELLVKLSGNQPLFAAYKGSLNELRFYIRMTVRYYHSPEELRLELEKFLTAVREQRVDEALRLMHEHIEFGFKDAMEKLE